MREISADEAAVRVQSMVRGRNARAETKQLSTLARMTNNVIQNTFVKPFECMGSLISTAGSAISGATDETMKTVGLKHDKLPPLTDAEVEAPTPEDRWFTPQDGWTCTDAKGNAPHLMTHTARSCAELFHHAKDAIGELRVEVLECKGLPQLLQLGRVDPYACIIFEANAARNMHIQNRQNPRWGRHSPRAFKFPITCPYAAIWRMHP